MTGMGKSDRKKTPEGGVGSEVRAGVANEGETEDRCRTFDWQSAGKQEAFVGEIACKWGEID